jgi:hypothetical protein
MGTNKSRSRGGFAIAWAIFRLLLAPEYRGLVLSAALVVAAIGGTLYGWTRWGAVVIGSPEYTLTPERIQVTPQPAWIHASVKAEVLRTVNATRLNLHDRDLVERLAQAFALHPWVAEVLRVEKRYPAAAQVELRYRRPVLVVKLDVPGEEGLLFLDEDSVLLPSADFAPSQGREYLRIAAQGETPASIYGTRWGTERMARAARVAAAWQKRWQPLGLYWLIASRPASGELLYELRTQDDKVRVLWGTAGSTETGDPTAEEKITALERYVQDKGPLTAATESLVIDLRDLARHGEREATRFVPPKTTASR